jgi:hypothetical protein
MRIAVMRPLATRNVHPHTVSGTKDGEARRSDKRRVGPPVPVVGVNLFTRG